MGLFAVTPARAQRLELVGSVDGAIEYVTAAPSGKFTAPSDDQPRTLSGKAVRGDYGPLTFMSVGAELSIGYGSWIFSVLGARVGGAIGPYSAALRSVDGSPVRLRPWSAWHADVTGLGLRYRKNLRRWSVGAGFTLGAGFLIVPADVGYGAESIPGNVMTPTWMLRGSVEGCRRLDPVTRVCVAFMPYIHQYKWFDGGALALRWEVG